MSRDFFEIEKGLGIAQENGDTLIQLLSGTAVPDGLLNQATAPIGSLYIRSGVGEIYQKTTNIGDASDWELNGSASNIISRWRNEQVCLTTDDDLSAGSFDVTTLTDLESTLLVADTPVGGYITDGTGELYEITANGSFPTITIAAAATAPVEGDAFITKKYLPDSSSSQENQAGVLFSGGAFIKIFDIDWNFATGINLSSGYSSQNGDPTQGDSVELAIEKLDGNQDDLQTLSGVTQGSTDLGTFTGTTIPDASNNKEALQSLETAHEEVDQNVDDLIALSGVPENSTDQGIMDQGDILSDAQTNNALFKEIDAELTRERGKNQALAVAAPTVVDSVLVDDVAACMWEITVKLSASPARTRSFVVHAIHDGHSAADATGTDDTSYARLRLGANFNVDISTSVSGTGVAQTFNLVLDTSEAGIDVYVKRHETLF